MFRPLSVLNFVVMLVWSSHKHEGVRLLMGKCLTGALLSVALLKQL